MDAGFHLFFERVYVVPVNFRVSSGSFTALEFCMRGCYFIFPVFRV